MPSIASRKVLRGAERLRTLVFCLVALMAAVSSGVLLAADPAHAAAFRVNSMGDAADNSSTDGECATEPFRPGTEPNCTLRAAIGEANFNGQGDTIVFDPALSGTITLTLGQLRIEDDTAATDDLSIQGPGAGKITVSGNDASRVFSVNPNVNATIGGLTIRDGSTPNGGGGIINGGTLELLNTTVSGNNAAGDDGGGIYSGRGGTLRLTNSTVSGNTVSGNFDEDFMPIGGNGGGIYNIGTVELLNSTVSGNTAENGGGGISSDRIGIVALRNTIVAGNAGFDGPDARGTFTSRGTNLIGDVSGSSGWGPSDLLNVGPLLGPLQDNGGPTHTHALLPGSLAVDAASNAACPSEDQRGVLRKDGDKDGTVTCDIGAFERNDLDPPRVTATTPTAGKTGVRRNADLIATFSEGMDGDTITKATFKLFRVTSSGTTQVTNTTVGLSSDGLRATLDPFGASATLLARNARYKAVVTTGARDAAGNRLDQSPRKRGLQQKAWTFTTGAG